MNTQRSIRTGAGSVIPKSAVKSNTAADSRLCCFFLFLILANMIFDRLMDFSLFYTFGQAFLAVAFVFVVDGGRFRMKLPDTRSMLFPYLLYILYAFFVTAVNITVNYTAFIRNGVFNFINTSVLTLAVLYYIGQRTDWDRFYRVFRNAGIVIALMGLYETVTQRNFFYRLMNESSLHLVNAEMVGTSDYRIFICFGHPIVAGTFLVCVWVLTTYYPLKNWLADLIIKLVLLADIISTQSRSSWLALAAVLLVSIAGRFDFKNTKLSAVKYLRTLAIAVGLLVIIFLLKNRIRQAVMLVYNRLMSVASDRNARSRLVRVSNFRNVMSYIKRKPLNALIGRGAGYALQFSTENVVARDWAYGMDNQYLTTLLSEGFIGLFMLALSALSGLAAFFRSRDAAVRTSVLLMVAVLVSVIFFDGIENWRIVNFLFCLSLVAGSMSFKRTGN